LGHLVIENRQRAAQTIAPPVALHFLLATRSSRAARTTRHRLRARTAIEDPAVVGKILRHLGLSAVLPVPRPPPAEIGATCFMDNW
jgi:hypothetical protein